MTYGLLNPDKGSAKPMVAEKSIEEWVKAWWHWFYSIEEKQHPAYSSADYNVRNNDYNQGRTPADWKDNTKKKVWFLAGAHGTKSISRSIIPASETTESWAILAAAYNMGVSKAEFPSLTDLELEKLLNDDMDGVGTDLDDARKKGNLLVTLDGEDLTDKLQRVNTDWFAVTHIPDENILALDVDQILMKSDGYYIWLEYLSPGDHVLHLHGKAKNYESDMTFNLTVRGPGKK